MVFGYIVLAVCLFVVYNATQGNSRFAPTNSFIREVWTGQCGRLCTRGATVPSDSGTDHLECLCETCPCALFQTYFIGAAKQCIRAADAMCQCYAQLTNRIEAMFRAARYSGPRHAQLAECSRPSFCTESITNFTIVEGTAEEEPQQNDCIIFKTQSKNMILPESSVTEYVNGLINRITDNATDSPRASQTETLTTCSGLSSMVSSTTNPIQMEETFDPRDNYCSKCIEQGKTCYRACPNAETKLSVF